MKNLLGLTAALLASSAFIASPAAAATFINVGDSENIDFGGTEPGTSANLILTLAAANLATNVFTFNYTLTNTSNALINPSSRVRGFAFNDIGVAATSGSASTVDANGFNQLTFNIASYSGGLGGRDVCLFRSPGNCLGGGSGATLGDPAIGSFTLDYAGSGLAQLVFDNFAVRYQSTGINGRGSGVGEPIVNPVPEPTTWAMMLLGFWFVGGAMRAARRRQKLTVSYA